MSTLKVNALQDTSGKGFYPARAWAQFSMTGTPSLTTNQGVSSLTDNSTGNNTFNLSNALSGSGGSAYLCHAVYSNGVEAPIQAGAHITSTTTVKGFCGSDSTTRNDWQEGYFGVTR